MDKKFGRIMLGVLVWVCLAKIVMAQEPSQPEVSDAPRGLFEIVFSGGIIGTSIIAVLVMLSMTATYLVIEHLLTIRRQDLFPESLQRQIFDHLKRGRFSEVQSTCQANPSLLSYVVTQGLAEHEGGWSSVQKALEDALADQAARLVRKIEYLSVIGNIAPMVGLLGTVTGMIFAFQQVANTQGAAGAGDLAEGIYQALVTTVGGLLVAIPSLAAYAILRNRVDQLVAEATYAVQYVTRPLKRQLPPGPAPPPLG